MSTPPSLASWTRRFTGAESGLTIATILEAFIIFPKPILMNFMLTSAIASFPVLLNILDLFAYFFDLRLDLDHALGYLDILTFGTDSI